MRYKVKLTYRDKDHISRHWFVKRSNVVGFQTHREDGPAREVVLICYNDRKYNWVRNLYYLRDHQYRNRYYWSNGLKYKKYSKNSRGMI